MADASAFAEMAEVEFTISDSSLLNYSKPEDAPSSNQQGAADTSIRDIIIASPTSVATTADSEIKVGDEESNLRSSLVSFGEITCMTSGQPIQSKSTSRFGGPASVATAVATADDSGQTEMEKLHFARPRSFKDKRAKKRKGLRKNSKKPSRRKLSKVSEKYDLDGDGVLNKVEQAMRDRDLDGDGRLGNAEVHKIIQDRLKSQRDVHVYKKAAAGLACLLAILALSNFGTSWASANLAKDTLADGESGTVRSKKSGEVVGFQAAAFNYDLIPLDDDEFEERRRLVDSEMAEDPDHEDHIHRQLGRKKKKNGVKSKIEYDHGKIREEDMVEIAKRCDGGNTVSIERRWKRYDITDVDIAIVCDPGTVVVRKKKKKRNKRKTKTKDVDKRVSLRRKGKDGRDKSISFDCEGGYCYASGGALVQREGHPCDIGRDRSDASECDERLTCYDPDDHSAWRGTGVCAALVPYAGEGRICSIVYGVDACASGHSCRPTRNYYLRSGGARGAGVRTGLCEPVAPLSAGGEVCDISLGDDACVVGYRCLGKNGRDIGRVGVGLCAQST